MDDADRDYYLLRAEQERERATTSETPDVAARHLAMARLYELRVSDPNAWAALSLQHSG